ncbi:PQQ-dependent sugar dehydrogenase [Marinobacterium arenosum]|uniref:PQQ-dependent sugar dehydrogenase n=1 Tax=Marinobacterium arenosum TaxID=2862496 RepID=UPI001C95443F|nr:PQQ-dependent sugar dehydrogenase [Marinobacterium arenosum]MBY4676506.1 PQQ-dependent sugar dehydrogenase [Marinobacterium arenosum]
MRHTFGWLCLCCLIAGLPAGPATALPLERLQLPDGYRISLAARLDNARQLALAPDGTLFVGSRRAGNVYRLRDRDGDGQYEQVERLLSRLELPSGIAFHDGKLYIAALSRILRLDDPLAEQPARPVVLTDRLPDATHHGWKYLKVGPDNQLYFNIGAPCNVCLSKDPRFATLVRMPLSGGKVELVALGVRNSVGFDWHPQDGALWFTDNGRDWLGDDQPADELNRLDRLGQHFGFPYLHGDGLADPDYGSRNPYRNSQPPVLALGAHVAPLGMVFSQAAPWAAPDETSLLIAQHGSWNRSEKVGYRVIKVRLKGNQVLEKSVLVDGWLRADSYWGRPVDLLFDRDGSLLISDDYADAIYRLSPPTTP